MASTKESTSEKKSRRALVPPPVIVDLGQKSRKKINRMKKGEGPLYDAVCETVDTLQSEGVIGKDVQVVIAVVERVPTGGMIPTLTWN